MLKFGKLAVIAVVSALCASQADAAITINIVQVGPSVVATGSGTFYTEMGLGPVLTGDAGPAVRPDSGILRVGSAGTLSYRTGLSGNSLGTGPLKFATSSTGDLFGVGSFASLIYLPVNYTSGAALNGTATYANDTIASLGLVPGTYFFATPYDFVTVNIDGAVPEPATWAMMIAGVGIVGGAMRRRKKAALVAA